MKKLFVLLFFFSIIFDLKTVEAQDTSSAAAAWQVSSYDINASLLVGERTLNAKAIVSLINVGRGTATTATFRINQKAEIVSSKVNSTDVSFRKTVDDKLGNLQRFAVNLPASVPSNQNIVIAIDYRLPVAENNGLSAISEIGSQFLPLSNWYPTPNNYLSPRGADFAKFNLKVTAPNNETVVSSGALKNNLFAQNLNSQPFFVTGNWEVVETPFQANSGSNVNFTAFLPKNANSEEKQRALDLLKLTEAAHAYCANLLGSNSNINNYKLVAVRRGAGFADGGTILLDPSVFRRSKLDSQTAMTIVEAVAKVFLGNAVAVRGEGSGTIREGLSQFVATQFIEKQFGKDVAALERMRQRIVYSGAARNEAPLSQTSPADETYFAAVANKGALAWRLIARDLGDNKFYSVIRTQFEAAASEGLTLSKLRAALAAQGNEQTKALLDYEFDQVTDTDLLVGLPQSKNSETVVAVRNQGSLPVTTSVSAVTDKGEILTVNVNIAAKSFGEAIFKTAAKIVRVEIDPEKLYPQYDYANDIAPHLTAENDFQVDVARLFNRQEYVKAEALARQCLNLQPRYDEVRVLLGRSLLEQNKLEDAEKEFKNILNETLPAPKSLAWANIGLGRVALARNQSAPAAKFFDAAIKVNAEYGSNLAARSGRIAAENKSNSNPPIDETAKQFFLNFDRAVQSARKAEVASLIVSGDLTRFSGGIVGGQPELWQTKVLRTEIIDANLLAVDVNLNAKLLGQEQQTGTALFTLARTATGLKLSNVDLFEVK